MCDAFFSAERLIGLGLRSLLSSLHDQALLPNHEPSNRPVELWMEIPPDPFEGSILLSKTYMAK